MHYKQGIFTDYKQPFAVTYLGASLMVIYLPIAFIKDWIYKLIKKGKNQPSVGLNSPLKYVGGPTMFEMEVEGSSLSRKGSDQDISNQEEGNALVPKIKNDSLSLKHEVTTREVATYGFYIAPIWFVTEVTI